MGGFPVRLAFRRKEQPEAFSFGTRGETEARGDVGGTRLNSRRSRRGRMRCNATQRDSTRLQAPAMRQDEKRRNEIRWDDKGVQSWPARLSLLLAITTPIPCVTGPTPSFF